MSFRNLFGTLHGCMEATRLIDSMPLRMAPCNDRTLRDRGCSDAYRPVSSSDRSEFVIVGDSEIGALRTFRADGAKAILERFTFRRCCGSTFARRFSSAVGRCQRATATSALSADNRMTGTRHQPPICVYPDSAKAARAFSMCSRANLASISAYFRFTSSIADSRSLAMDLFDRRRS